MRVEKERVERRSASRGGVRLEKERIEKECSRGGVREEEERVEKESELRKGASNERESREGVRIEK